MKVTYNFVKQQFVNSSSSEDFIVASHNNESVIVPEEERDQLNEIPLPINHEEITVLSTINYAAVFNTEVEDTEIMQPVSFGKLGLGKNNVNDNNCTMEQKMIRITRDHVEEEEEELTDPLADLINQGEVRHSRRRKQLICIRNTQTTEEEEIQHLAEEGDDDDDVKIHKGIHSTNGKPYLCKNTDCGQWFTSPIMLNRHTKTHEIDQLLSSSPLTNTTTTDSEDGCNIEQVLSSNSYKTIYTTQSNAGQVSETSTSNKNRPTSSQTGEKPFACDWPECKQRFTRRYSLNMHRNTHTGQKPFACDWPECKQRFTRNGDLKKHKMIHTGEKPFACDWPDCKRQFARSTTLIYHKRIHTGEKPYICNWPGCNQRFTQTSNLNTHQRIHIREQVACCKTRLTTNENLKKHKIIHTGSKYVPM